MRVSMIICAIIVVVVVVAELYKWIVKKRG